jgi:hypothetical protein
MSFLPLMMIGGGFMQTAEARFEKLMKAAYARAANVAGEALGSFKTVTAFGGARLEVTKYSNNLSAAEAAGKKKAMGTGLGMVRVCVCV